ncbi:hypothetical protein ACVWZL_009074 [Bradyrhizobium sp. GM2.4]
MLSSGDLILNEVCQSACDPACDVSRFFIAGFGMGALAPFAREGLSVDDDVRGFLLLCLDMGPVAAMLWRVC